MSPSISIVIPLYNKAPYVTESVLSVHRQGEGVAEIIVVDDGSTDGSIERVQELDIPSLRFIRQANAGVSEARNTGLREARGELVGFLDADDIYLPGFIDSIARLAIDFPRAALFATAYRCFDGSSLSYNDLHKSLRSHRGYVQDFFAAWRVSSFFWTGSAVLRRESMLKAGISFPAGERLGEDQDVWFRMAERYDLAFDSNVCAEYRTAVIGSATNSSYPLAPLPCYERLAERIKAHEFPQAERSQARKLTSSHWLGVANHRLQAGDLDGAWKIFRASNWLQCPRYGLRTARRLIQASLRCD